MSIFLCILEYPNCAYWNIPNSNFSFLGENVFFSPISGQNEFQVTRETWKRVSLFCSPGVRRPVSHTWSDDSEVNMNALTILVLN